MSDDQRLDRIESKIDKLSDAMITIARVEEKMINMEQKYIARAEELGVKICLVFL
jgi:hypothetical protein